MTGQELLDYVRTDILRDTASPYLWSDDLIFRMLNEAQNAFARNTYILLSNSETIDITAGTSEYQLPATVLKVLSAALSGTAYDLMDYTHRRLPNSVSSLSGTPRIFTCDEASNIIRFYPVPNAAYTVVLRVAMLPMTQITADTSPEIPSVYHTDLAEYVAWRLLQSNDVDGESVGAADRHRRDWFERLSNAKRETYRMRTNMSANAARSWTHQRNR